MHRSSICAPWRTLLAMSPMMLSPCSSSSSGAAAFSKRRQRFDVDDTVIIRVCAQCKASSRRNTARRLVRDDISASYSATAWRSAKPIESVVWDGPIRWGYDFIRFRLFLIFSFLFKALLQLCYVTVAFGSFRFYEVHSFLHSFIHSFIRSFIHSFIHSFIQ